MSSVGSSSSISVALSSSHQATLLHAQRSYNRVLFSIAGVKYISFIDIRNETYEDLQAAVTSTLAANVVQGRLLESSSIACIDEKRPQAAMSSAVSEALLFYNASGGYMECEAMGYQMSIDSLFRHICPPEAGVCLGPPDALSVTAVLKRLGLVGLRSVGPSVSVGVGRNELVVRKNCQSSVLNTPHADVDIWTYRYNVVCTLIHYYPSLSNFHYIFVQATGGNGKAGEIRLKVFTAMRIGLQIYLDLFRRAHAADESNCMPLPEFARQSFGFTTIGPIWEILVMVAREDRSQGRSGRVDFPVASVWTGNVGDPKSMAKMIGIMQKIMSTSIARGEVISNWLWCLRTTSMHPLSDYNGSCMGGDEQEDEGDGCSIRSLDVVPKKRAHAFQKSPQPSMEAKGCHDQEKGESAAMRAARREKIWTWRTEVASSRSANSSVHM